MTSAVLLVAHGSPHASAREVARTWAAGVTEALGGRVELCWLDHDTPTPDDAPALLDGVGDVLLQPLILLPGQHSEDDVTALARQLAEQPGRVVRVAETVGAAADLVAAAARRAAVALTASGSRGVLLASSGTQRVAGRLEAARVAATVGELLRADGVADDVVLGFVGTGHPSVAEARRRLALLGHEHPVVLPWTLADGHIVGRLRPDVEGLTLLEPLGATSMPTLVAATVATALAAAAAPPLTLPSTGGHVALVGGGPGDPGLLTRRGADLLAVADVVVADRLAPAWSARPGVEVVDVGKASHGDSGTQAAINDLLVERALQGKRVVRLKGGDPFVLGRGGEELSACAAAGVAVEVVPGVTSALAAPALAGIPVTHRGSAAAFAVVSAHVAPGDPGDPHDWAALARFRGTLVLLMAAGRLPVIAARLLAEGAHPALPAAVVRDASLPSQAVQRATLATLAELTVEPPAVVLVGQTAGLDLG